jgi:hypothetical protein
MTDNEQQRGGIFRRSAKRRGSSLAQIAIWLNQLATGELKRESRRPKNEKPPTRGIVGPINFGEDEMPWVWMEVMPARGYPWMENARQRGIESSFNAVLKSFAGWQGSRKAVEIDLQVQSWPFDFEAINRDLQESVVGELPEEFKEELEELQSRSRQLSIEEIERLGFDESRIFVGVKLRDERALIVRVLAKFLQLLGFGLETANGDDLVLYREQIQEVKAKLENNNLKVRLLRGMETARVIQHCVFRGHKKLPALPKSTELISSSNALCRLADATAIDQIDMVEIIQDGEFRYAAYMAVADLPTDYEGLSWLYFGDQHGRRVEVSARLHVEPLAHSKAQNAGTLNIIEGSITHSLKQIARESAKGHSVGGLQTTLKDHEARKAVATAEKARLEQGVPKVDVHAFLVVSGDDPDKVRTNSLFVMDQCASDGVVLEIDEANNAEVRRQTYPGTRQIYKRYELPMFSDGMAQAMPHATSVIGNGGDLLGIAVGPEADSGPCRYSHRKVLKKNSDDPPGEVVWGPSGGGKTSFLLNTGIADALAGMATIYDEGGKDDSLILKGATLPVPHMVMDLSSPEMAGLLNPLFLGENRKESRDMALDVLMRSIGSEAERGWRSIIAIAISAEQDEHPEDPDFKRIVRERLLGADPSDPRRAVKVEIGEAILGIMEAENAEIIFAKGKSWKSVARKYVARGQFTLVVYGHLTPPHDRDTPDDKLTTQQRLAIIVRQLTNALYYKIAMDPAIPAAIKKDEIHIDHRLDGGVASGHLSRVGRYSGSTVTEAGQLVEDVKQDFLANTSTIWCFRLRQAEQAELAIQRMGLNVVKGSDESPSPEYQWFMQQMMATPDEGRAKYTAFVRMHDGQFGQVLLNQMFHGGQFVSNPEAVEERRRLTRDAEEVLVRLGVPPEVVQDPNGHELDVQQMKAIAMDLHARARNLSARVGESRHLPEASAGEEVPQ